MTTKQRFKYTIIGQAILLLGQGLGFLKPPTSFAQACAMILLFAAGFWTGALLGYLYDKMAGKK